MEIDSNCFRTFKVTCQTLNFTEASRRLGMTQSGVSQHVARLERDLGAALFLRIGKKVILTESGQALLRFIDAYQDQVNGLKDSIQEITSSVKGLVSYGMPATCLVSPHFRLFLEVRRESFPELELSVDLLPSDEVVSRVLTASLDFGFVTKKVLHEDLDYQTFCEEEYVLVSSRTSALPAPGNFAWISYPGSEVLTEAWVGQQETKLKKALSFRVSGKTNSLHAALIMVAQDVGVMVVPRHCIESSGLQSELRIQEVGKRSVRNTIFTVTLKSGASSQRVRVVLEAFHGLKSP